MGSTKSNVVSASVTPKHQPGQKLKWAALPFPVLLISAGFGAVWQRCPLPFSPQAKAVFAHVTMELSGRICQCFLFQQQEAEASALSTEGERAVRALLWEDSARLSDLVRTEGRVREEFGHCDVKYFILGDLAIVLRDSKQDEIHFPRPAVLSARPR